MSTTSSEDKADGYDSAQRGSETAEEGEEDTINVHEDDERDRKRRRISSTRQALELEREVRMERYAKARIREIDAAKKEEGSSKTHKKKSRDTSRSRSSATARRSRSKSPATSQIQPSRVGKRVRRRPQRWEGASEKKELKAPRSVGAASSRSRDVELASRESDGEQTVSENSAQFEPEAPVIDDPMAEMRKAVAKCGSEFSRRAIVDSFHTWQLQAVSRQAAQQKALHVYLKRKLRKRTARTPELDRLEEEALRNARTATVKAKSSDKDGNEMDDKIEAVGVGSDENKLVPSKIRLPLEAYLPRRVRASKEPTEPEDVLMLLPPQPRLPGEADHSAGDSGKPWMEMRTVSTSSLLNKQKNGSKQRTARSLHAM